MLFDTGSHRKYITEALAKNLNLKRGEESEINLVTFGTEKPKTHRTAETTICIMLKGGMMKITANVVPNIIEPILRRPVQCKSIQNWSICGKKKILQNDSPLDSDNEKALKIFNNNLKTIDTKYLGHGKKTNQFCQKIES